MDFNAPIGSKEREWFNSSLAESEENIQLKCEIKSENDGCVSKCGYLSCTDQAKYCMKDGKCGNSI